MLPWLKYNLLNFNVRACRNQAEPLLGDALEKGIIVLFEISGRTQCKNSVMRFPSPSLDFDKLLRRKETAVCVAGRHYVRAPVQRKLHAWHIAVQEAAVVVCAESPGSVPD